MASRMNHFALSVVVGGTLALAVPVTPAFGWVETPEARQEATEAAQQAQADMLDAFGKDKLPNGQFIWKDGKRTGALTRVVISLSGQLAFAYRGDELVGVSTISSGKADKPTPTGIFPILEKKRHHRSIKYDNAPMPYMQRLDTYGIAMHGGNLPGYPASHGCVRFPNEFASKLFATTQVGTEVFIGD